MMATFNPQMQIAVARDTDSAYFGPAPTLGLLARTYGENTPVMWLLPQIYDLCEYAGVKKMDDWQAEQLATIIACGYGHLKVSELLLFFFKFKAGRYGRFFGVADPMIVTAALADFARDRACVVAAHEQRLSEQRQRLEQSQRDKPVTLQEFCRMKGLPDNLSLPELCGLSAK